MESTSQTNADVLNYQAPKRLPGMLNVLTILTFIGCGISYLSLLANHFTTTEESMRQDIQQAEEAIDQFGEGFFSRMMEGAITVMEKSYDNRYLLLITGLVATTLCLVGALRMRKLQKSGFNLYLIGQIVPIIVNFALFGTNWFGAFAILFSSIISIIFIILYATQRKHLR